MATDTQSPATDTQSSDKTVTYELSVRRGGRWVAEAAYPRRDRALALYDAKKLALLADVEAAKVTKEAWSADIGEIETLVIYHSSHEPVSPVRRQASDRPVAAKASRLTTADWANTAMLRPGLDLPEFESNRRRPTANVLSQVLMSLLVSSVIGFLVAIGASLSLQYLASLGYEFGNAATDATIAGVFLIGSGFCFAMMLAPILRRLPLSKTRTVYRRRKIAQPESGDVIPAAGAMDGTALPHDGARSAAGRNTDPTPAPAVAPTVAPEETPDGGDGSAPALPLAADGPAPAAEAQQHAPAADPAPATDVRADDLASPPDIQDGFKPGLFPGMSPDPQQEAAAAALGPPMPADIAPMQAVPEHVVAPTLVRARFDAFELALVRGLGDGGLTLDPSRRFALGLYLSGAADRLIAAEGLSPESAQLLLTPTLARLGVSSDGAREFGAAMNDYLIQARSLAMYERGRDALARQLAGVEDATDIDAAFAEWDQPQAQPAPGPEILTILRTRIVRPMDMTIAGERPPIAAGEPGTASAHDRIVRNALAEHHGREILHDDDGIVAGFRVPSHAVDAAHAMLLSIEAHNAQDPASQLTMQLGLDAGETQKGESGGDGPTMLMAEHLCQSAKPGQALASNVVRMLCSDRSKRFQFVGDVPPLSEDGPLSVYAIITGVETDHEAPAHLPDAPQFAQRPTPAHTATSYQTGETSGVFSPHQSLRGGLRNKP